MSGAEEGTEPRKKSQEKPGHGPSLRDSVDRKPDSCKLLILRSNGILTTDRSNSACDGMSFTWACAWAPNRRRHAKITSLVVFLIIDLPFGGNRWGHGLESRARCLWSKTAPTMVTNLLLSSINAGGSGTGGGGGPMTCHVPGSFWTKAVPRGKPLGW
jgi:hypothetical protein